MIEAIIAGETNPTTLAARLEGWPLVCSPQACATTGAALRVDGVVVHSIA